MFKHIIWDFDGTLFDTYPVINDILREHFLKSGIDEPIEDITKLTKISMKYAIKYYQNKYNISDEFLAEYNKRVKKEELFRAKPFEGIPDICEKITSNGGFHYLFTHRGNSSFELLDKNGLLKYFRECITSKEAFERKPSPEGILYLIDKYEMKQEEAIMIGDREIDVMSGKNAGIYSCFFNSDRIYDVVSDYYVDSMEQLKSVLLKGR
ncbi:MAG: family hydrolase [Anaerocolumna sp.]|jgi:phosphoglycolate phosphatase-like HAD superfamily hydrolase|nr:family hydrolase [Anaerocolumna sp.]